MRKTALFILLLVALLPFGLSAQQPEPIKWKVTVENNTCRGAVIRYHADIAPGWHLYGFEMPDDGPNATKITVAEQPGVTLGEIVPARAPRQTYDAMFELNLSWWAGSIDFTQNVTVTDRKQHTLDIKVKFQGCNDECCLPPQTLPFTVKVGKGACAR